MPSIAITQPYEAVYILDPTLGDEQIGATTTKYRNVVETGGGAVGTIDVWERRRLAYEIKGRTEGIYVVMQFEAKPMVEAELRRVFQISEDQIRYMIVRRDENEADAPMPPPRSHFAASAAQAASAPAPAPVEVPAPAPAVEEAPTAPEAPAGEAPVAETAATETAPVAETAATETAPVVETETPAEAAA
jgi:small subunit ribosomal protein S6